MILSNSRTVLSRAKLSNHYTRISQLYMGISNNVERNLGLLLQVDKHS